MAAMSLRGYWRTLIVFIACKPAIRMTKLTTIASTGRLMNRSVKDFILNVRHSERSEAESKNPVALQRSVFASSSRIYRSWVYLRFGCEIVVDRHRHHVA